MNRGESRYGTVLPPSGGKPDPAGFTLLEVMIAIAILAITFTALFGSQSRSLSLAAEAKFNTIAALLAQEKLAEFEAGLTSPAGDEGNFGDGFPGFTWKSEVRDAELFDIPGLDNLEPPLQRIELTISWQDEQFSTTMTYFGREKQE